MTSINFDVKDECPCCGRVVYTFAVLSALCDDGGGETGFIPSDSAAAYRVRECPECRAVWFQGEVFDELDRAAVDSPAYRRLTDSPPLYLPTDPDGIPYDPHVYEPAEVPEGGEDTRTPAEESLFERLRPDEFQPRPRTDNPRPPATGVWRPAIQPIPDDWDEDDEDEEPLDPEEQAELERLMELFFDPMDYQPWLNPDAVPELPDDVVHPLMSVYLRLAVRCGARGELLGATEMALAAIDVAWRMETAPGEHRARRIAALWLRRLLRRGTDLERKQRVRAVFQLADIERRLGRFDRADDVLRNGEVEMADPFEWALLAAHRRLVRERDTDEHQFRDLRELQAFYDD